MASDTDVASSSPVASAVSAAQPVATAGAVAACAPPSPLVRGQSPPRAVPSRPLTSSVPSAPDDDSNYGSASPHGCHGDGNGSREGDGALRVGLASGSAGASVLGATVGGPAAPSLRRALASAKPLQRAAKNAGDGGVDTRAEEETEEEEEEEGEEEGEEGEGSDVAGLADDMSAVETDQEDDRSEKTSFAVAQDAENEALQSGGRGDGDAIVSAAATPASATPATFIPPPAVAASATPATFIPPPAVAASVVSSLASRRSGDASSAARSASPPVGVCVPSAPSSVPASNLSSSSSLRSSPGSSVTSPPGGVRFGGGPAGGSADGPSTSSLSSRSFGATLTHSRTAPALRQVWTDSSDPGESNVLSRPLPTALPFPDDGGVSEGSSDDSLLEAPMGSWSEVTRPAQDTTPIGRAAGAAAEPRGRAPRRPFEAQGGPGEGRGASSGLGEGDATHVAGPSAQKASATACCEDREAYGIHESGSACAVGAQKQPFFGAPLQGEAPSSRSGTTSATLSSREHSREAGSRGRSRSGGPAEAETGAGVGAGVASGDEAASTTAAASAPGSASAARAPSRSPPPPASRSAAWTPRGAAGRVDPRDPYPASSPSPPPPGGVSPARAAAGGGAAAANGGGGGGSKGGYASSSSRRLRRLRPEDDRVWQTIRREAAADASSEPLLSSYLFASVLSHPSLERSLAFVLSSRLADATLLGTELFGLFLATMRRDPSIANAARADLVAVRERDPACRQFSTALLHFKGFQALQTHRIAHALWMGGRKALALVLQSRGNEVFAVDMHPAARVGRGVLLDHGTGIVVGATAVIGDDVSLLQNVTLGGTGKEQGDRHPKIGRGVLIGASATVLGNIEVGEGAQVASGSMVLKPVPPHALVAGSPARVVGKARGVPARLMNHWCPCGKDASKLAPPEDAQRDAMNQAHRARTTDGTDDAAGQRTGGATGGPTPPASPAPSSRPPPSPPVGGAAAIAAVPMADALAGAPHHVGLASGASAPAADGLHTAPPGVDVPADDAGILDPFFTGFRSAHPHASDGQLRARRMGVPQSSEGALSAALGAAAARADEDARGGSASPTAFVSSAVATAKAPLETHSSIGREAAHSPALSFDAWDYQI